MDPKNMSQWGLINFDWADASNIWQDTLPDHNNEAVLVEQCKMVKAEGTGTRCMVYRNTELALQWQESSRAAMTQANVDRNVFLKYKTKDLCENSAPCNIAAYHNANQPPLIPCNKNAPISEPNCGNCCNFSTASNPLGAYNEPIGGGYPRPGHNTSRFGTNALGDGQLFWDFRTQAAQDIWAQKVMFEGTQHDAVDGAFTDDPTGYGAEHPQVQSNVQVKFFMP
jgi:hypothetical protein